MQDDRRFVFFDFDGVISDSHAPAFEIAQKVCVHMTMEKHRRHFEGNINDWKLADELDHSSCDHDADWWGLYLPEFKQRAHPFPGSIRAVQELAEKYRLAIISSTISSPIMEFLKKYDAAHYFSDVMGNDVHPSKVEKMNMLFERYSLSPEHCVLITDTLGDMREAGHVHVGAIGVSWGYHERERLEKGNLFKIVEHPHELPEAVEAYFAAAK
jgi:phosphoglycolate phosphatase-like HAD superfamily hydrolase